MEELLRYNLLAGHAIAASGSVAVASSLTHPLDTLKSLLQVPASRRVFRKCSTEFDPSREFRAYTADSADGREDNYVHVSEALLAGLTAGAVEALLNTPFELFKLREQLSSASYAKKVNSPKLAESQIIQSSYLKGFTPDRRAWNYTVGLLSALPKNSSKWADSLKECPWMLTGSGRPPLASEMKNPSSVLKLEGFGALWRGLRSGIARDSIFSGVFFSTWQFLHSSILDWKAVHMIPPPRFGNHDISL